MPRWKDPGGSPSTHPYSKTSKLSSNDDVHAKKWLQQEDGFMLKQKKHGAIIRLKQQRQQHIDHLVAVSWLLDEHQEEHDESDLYESLALILEPPSSVIKKMSKNDLGALLSQVPEFLKLESTKNAKNFWNLVQIYCECQKQFLDKSQEDSAVYVVSPEVEDIIGNKSMQELEELESTIESNAEDPDMDNDFWSEILTHLKMKKLELELQSFYDSARTKLSQAKKENVHQKPSKNNSTAADDAHGNGTSIIPTFTSKKVRTIYSTVADVYDDTEEETDLQLQPVEVPRSKPGKMPVYHTKVFSGYDWNRYNQIHYSQDNPPPKTIKGYQFMLEYPELQNQHKTPSYRVLTDPDTSAENPETVLLQFRAPSIYQDVAFKIKHDLWDKSPHPNAGYTSKFENGVLYLSFRFKRQRYKN